MSARVFGVLCPQKCAKIRVNCGDCTTVRVFVCGNDKLYRSTIHYSVDVVVMLWYVDIWYVDVVVVVAIVVVAWTDRKQCRKTVAGRAAAHANANGSSEPFNNHDIHRESKKTRHQTLGHNFTNYYPIFKILSLADSVVNLQQTHI